MIMLTNTESSNQCPSESHHTKKIRHRFIDPPNNEAISSQLTPSVGITEKTDPAMLLKASSKKKT